MPTYETVLKFWFEEIKPAQWWAKDPQFDRLISERFAQIHASAIRCELFEWRESAHGRLAEIILLDQFSRNMFRGTPESFAYDPLALALAQEAVSAGAADLLSPVERSFLYLPFMHSESLLIHEIAVSLYLENGLESNLNFELKHQAILEQFNRYPHRNAILGRTSTPEELAFLEQADSGF